MSLRGTSAKVGWPSDPVGVVRDADLAVHATALRLRALPVVHWDLCRIDVLDFSGLAAAGTDGKALQRCARGAPGAIGQEVSFGDLIHLG